MCLSVSFRHFTSNPHRLTLRLKGSTELAGQLEAQEKRALKEAEIEIGLEGIAAVAREQAALRQLQVNPREDEDTERQGIEGSTNGQRDKGTEDPEAERQGDSVTATCRDAFRWLVSGTEGGNGDWQ